MNSDNMQLNDVEFLQQFESKRLDPVHFNHLGHLRLAWIYLNNNTLEIAIESICRGIKAYAECQGANDKFNLSLTNAIVRIMANRMEDMQSNDWQAFQEQNSDLITDLPSVLLNHYSKQVLFSDEARLRLVSPDIKAI